MVSGLSFDDQLRDVEQSGVVARIGPYWRGRLEEWLETVLPYGCVEQHNQSPEDNSKLGNPSEDETVFEWSERHRRGIHSWSFPTEDLRNEYIGSVRDRSESDVFALLRLFLFEWTCFGSDQDHLDGLVRRPQETGSSFPVEYERRLFGFLGGDLMPQPGVRWIIDLLPQSPQQAIDVVKAYLIAYFGLLPDGRIDGLFDATAVIRARWIEDTNAEDIHGIDCRLLEKLTAALYRSLGYKVTLTPRTRDKGRDVVAVRDLPGQQEVVEVECKSSSRPIGVETVRDLQGVVSRGDSNKGVLVSAGSFTRGDQSEALDDPRIELVPGGKLIKLLNSRFGPSWQARCDRITWGLE